MLLTIDKAKVRKSLASSAKPAYVVNVSHLVIAELPPHQAPPSFVGGTTMFGEPRVSAETREYVTSMRRKIEESGVSLKTADELTCELDEMRGKGR
jgi:hypothetical protein